MTWECVHAFLSCLCVLRLEVLHLYASAGATLHKPKGMVCRAVGLSESELMVLLQPSQTKWLVVLAWVQSLQPEERPVSLCLEALVLLGNFHLESPDPLCGEEIHRTQTYSWTECVFL